MFRDFQDFHECIVHLVYQRWLERTRCFMSPGMSMLVNPEAQLLQEVMLKDQRPTTLLLEKTPDLGLGYL